ncbi:peroxiredoxin family protein [Nonomuraea typhae]|uniref:peroxiredoxin family protein n=1 Tax=Nonomuraea typhae TaxID=2603600 RepID=UPI0012FA81F1|nr:TlpA disulfide reductase family protein [Nonomuraea typhae]
MDIILLLDRLLLATIFAWSGLAKLADRPGTRRAMLDFGTPAVLAAPSALLLPVIELAVAGSLIPAASARAGATAALTLLVVFTVVVGYHVVRGHPLSCRCFGQSASAPVGWPTIARNLTLSAMAGIIVGFGTPGAGADVFAWMTAATVVDRVELGTGGLTAVLLVLGGAILLRQNARLLRRLHEIEARLGTEGATAVNTPAAADFRMRAPALRLPDLSGDQVTLDDLLAAGSPVLLVFYDPECAPCNALLPEVGRWQRDHADQLTLAVISRGTPEVNRDKADEHGIVRLLLQRDQEAAEPYQVHGTPCAVLIRADGIMHEPPACGEKHIRELVARAAGAASGSFLPVTADGSGGHALPMADAHTEHLAPEPSAEPRGLPIGDPAPAFALPDLNGRSVDLADLHGRSALLLFWNPACGFCEQMLPDLRAWEANGAQEGPALVVISTGTVEENRAMGLSSAILHDETFAVGPLFGAQGTPMAVVVDAEGRIASEAVAGAPGVLTLLTRPNPVPA